MATSGYSRLPPCTDPWQVGSSRRDWMAGLRGWDSPRYGRGKTLSQEQQRQLSGE